MQDTPQNLGSPASSLKRSPATSAIAAALIVAFVVGLWFLLGPEQNREKPVATENPALAMTPVEQEYRKKIEVGNLAFSRAENFLHQEVTIMNGEMYNGGTEAVSGLRITTEFSDDMNQVVLRETRGVLGTPELVLAPGERRTFEISFDHVPNSWNMQQPAVRVEYLHLPARK
jgi:hypothetical protein